MLVFEEEEENLLETCLTIRAFVGSNPGRLVIWAISELLLGLPEAAAAAPWPLPSADPVPAALVAEPPPMLAPVLPRSVGVVADFRRPLAGDSAVCPEEGGCRSERGRRVRQRVRSEERIQVDSRKKTGDNFNEEFGNLEDSRCLENDVDEG